MKSITLTIGGQRIKSHWIGPKTQVWMIDDATAAVERVGRYWGFRWLATEGGADVFSYVAPPAYATAKSARIGMQAWYGRMAAMFPRVRAGVINARRK